MVDRYDLQKISRMRLREARTLFKAERFEGAYYLMGYAVECALKACIARRTKRYEFPNVEWARQCYQHDLNKLAKTAQLYDEIWKTKDLKIYWALVKDWSVDIRYSTEVPKTRVKDMFKACNARKWGILSWLRSKW